MKNNIELQNHKIFLKNIIYILSLLIIYILQTSCQFLKINDVSPMMILSVVLSIAMFQSVTSACVYGFLGGILCDMALNINIGLSAIIFVMICTLVSLLTIYRLKINLISYMIFMSFFSLIEIGVITIFKYDIVNLFLFNKFFIKNVMLPILITEIIGVPIFCFFSYINKKLLISDYIFLKE